jgi:hypothetical protein
MGFCRLRPNALKATPQALPVGVLFCDCHVNTQYLKRCAEQCHTAALQGHARAHAVPVNVRQGVCRIGWTSGKGR